MTKLCLGVDGGIKRSEACHVNALQIRTVQTGAVAAQRDQRSTDDDMYCDQEGRTVQVFFCCN